MPTPEPALKGIKPSQRIKTPSAIIDTLCAARSTGLPSTNLPMRGPSASAPMKAATPESACTAPPPA
eukprot:1526236-Pleurochrysis_carterae.AAC.1